MKKSLILMNPIILLCVLLILAFWFTDVKAETNVSFSKGQTVYVPVYSHIYTGDKEVPFYLTATLSIRNTDPKHSITITLVDYYDSNGKVLVSYLKAPVNVGAMASIRYVVKTSDKAGGSGANFIVKWESNAKVNSPIIESIMIGTQSKQGVSFTSRGKVIEEKR